jgi:iron(III) transport system substrate-binding protein
MNLEQRLNRRRLLRVMAGGVAAVGVLPLLAACGGDDPTATPAAGAGQATPTTAGGAATPATTTGATPTTATTAASPTTATTAASPTTAQTGGTITVYSGRNENLVGPAMELFKQRTGIDAQVRYAGTSELAALLLEEGARTPADVFFSQDAGALGALSNAGLLAPLPGDLLNMVDPRFRSTQDEWVGVTGRARAVVYNTDRVEESDIPESILDFVEPTWKGRLGWAPTNASFQSFVTALRVDRGEDVAREWLENMRANNIRAYDNNNAIVTAVVNAEIDTGFVNHYYLLNQQAQAGGTLPAANYIYSNGDPGALVNIAGVAILASSGNQTAAESFVEFMLSDEAQRYFAEQTFEYPLVEGIEADPDLVPLADIQVPDIDLSDLADLEGTLELLRDVGLL